MLIALDRNLGVLWSADAGAAIEDVFVSDFGVDNINDLMVKTPGGLQRWSAREVIPPKAPTSHWRMR